MEETHDEYERWRKGAEVIISNNQEKCTCENHIYMYMMRSIL